MRTDGSNAAGGQPRPARKQDGRGPRRTALRALGGLLHLRLLVSRAAAVAEPPGVTSASESGVKREKTGGGCGEGHAQAWPRRAGRRASGKEASPWLPGSCCLLLLRRDSGSLGVTGPRLGEGAHQFSQGRSTVLPGGVEATPMGAGAVLGGHTHVVLESKPRCHLPVSGLGCTPPPPPPPTPERSTPFSAPPPPTSSTHIHPCPLLSPGKGVGPQFLREKTSSAGRM